MNPENAEVTDFIQVYSGYKETKQLPDRDTSKVYKYLSEIVIGSAQQKKDVVTPSDYACDIKHQLKKVKLVSYLLCLDLVAIQVGNTLRTQFKLTEKICLGHCCSLDCLQRKVCALKSG